MVEARSVWLTRKERALHCGQLSIVAYVLQMPFLVAGRNNNLAILISSGDGNPGTEDLELFQKEPKQVSPGLDFLFTEFCSQLLQS